MKLFKSSLFNQFIIGLLVISFIACSDTDSDYKPSIVVVLCDASKTVDTEQKNIFEYIRKIPFCFRKSSEIYFLPISENFSEKSFNNDNPIILPLRTDAETKENESDLIKANNEISSILIEINEFGKRYGEWTCLLTSIQNGYKLLKKRSMLADGKDFNYELIILSDMKESCLSTPIGNTGIKVEMGENKNLRNENHVQLDSAISVLKTFQPKNINFEENKINVTVILTSSGLTGSYARKINDIWQEIFQKMMYNKQLEMSSSFPFKKQF